MGEINRLKLKLVTQNKSTNHVTKPATLAKVIDWIKAKKYDEYTTVELIKKASWYPSSSLRDFYSNINLHVDAIRRKKLNEEEEIA
jgi:hypothetical protein